jgi:hypothetical protein
VALTNYAIVVWSAGQSLTNTFRALERNAVTNFLNRGGHLFVSGADIAWDLDRASGPAAADRTFLNSALHADLGADANNNSGSYTVAPAGGSIFAGNGSAVFDNGTRGVYWVQKPDALIPSGTGAVAALSYTGGNGGTAAVQYDGSAGGGRVVYLAFPFETITSAPVRSEYMADVLRFFRKPPRFEAVTLLADRSPRLSLSGEPGAYTLDSSTTLTNWSFLAHVTNVSGTFQFADEPATNSLMRFYRARWSD